MAAKISNINIGVTLDANNAQRGLSMLASSLDAFADRVKRAAAVGSFLGNLTFKAFEASVGGAVRMTEKLASNLLNIRLAADRAKFGQMVANGADPMQVVQTKEFDESVLGGFSKLRLAWDGLVDNVTKVFGPAISGIFTGAAAWVKWLGDNLGKALSAENLNLQGMFENCYKIAVDIGSTIVEAGLELVRLVNSVKLLGNKTVRNEVWDKILYDLGLINKKEWNRRLNENLKEGNKNGDIAGVNQWADQDAVLKKWKEKTADFADNLKRNQPKFDPEPLAREAGLLNGANAKPFDPMSIFGSSAGYNSDEAYRARMMLQYKDLFPEEQKNEQVEAVKENTQVLGGKMDTLIDKLGGLIPAGIMDFGVA